MTPNLNTAADVTRELKKLGLFRAEIELLMQNHHKFMQIALQEGIRLRLRFHTQDGSIWTELTSTGWWPGGEEGIVLRRKPGKPPEVFSFPSGGSWWRLAANTVADEVTGMAWSTQNWQEAWSAADRLRDRALRYGSIQ